MAELCPSSSRASQFSSKQVSHKCHGLVVALGAPAQLLRVGASLLLLQQANVSVDRVHLSLISILQTLTQVINMDIQTPGGPT